MEPSCSWHGSASGDFAVVDATLLALIVLPVFLLLLFPAVVEHLPDQELEEKHDSHDPAEADNEAALGPVDAGVVLGQCLVLVLARVVDPVISEEQVKEHGESREDANELADRDGVVQNLARPRIVRVHEHHDEEKRDDELASEAGPVGGARV